MVGEGRVFFSHAFLRIVEEAGINDCRFHYLTFRTPAGELVAHVPAYTIETDLLIFATGLLRRGVDRARATFPRLLKPSILECGCPVGLGSPLSLGRGVDFAGLAGQLGEALEALAADLGVRLLVMRDFREEELPVVAPLVARGYHPIQNLPVAELAVRWPSFDAYTAAMRSRYRSKLARHMRMAEAAGLRVEVWDDFAGLAERLARQWRNVYDHAKEYTRERLNPAFYRGLAGSLGGACRLVAVLRGDELVAHAPVLRDGHVLRWLFFGREEPNVRDSAYFLTIREVVRLAIETGMKEVEMGVTTYTAKGEMGARMVPHWMLLRYRGPVWGTILPRLHRLLNRVPTPRPEDVFTRAGEPDR